MECVSDPSVVDGNGDPTHGEQIIETFSLAPAIPMEILETSKLPGDL